MVIPHEWKEKNQLVGADEEAVLKESIMMIRSVHSKCSLIMKTKT